MCQFGDINKIYICLYPFILYNILFSIKSERHNKSKDKRLSIELEKSTEALENSQMLVPSTGTLKKLCLLG